MALTHVLVQRKLADGSQRVIGVWPDLGHIKDVPAICLCLLWIHDLEVERPGWEFTPVDGVEHVTGVIIWVTTGKLCCPIGGHILDTCVGLEVEFDVFE